MYPKNAASPPSIKAKVIDADGNLITSGVVAYHLAGTTRTAGAGTLTYVSGTWDYEPTQGETNYDEFAVEYYHASAIGGGPIVHVVTDQGYGATIAAIYTSMTNAGGFPDNFGSLNIDGDSGGVIVNSNLDKSGYSINGTIATLDALDNSLSSTHGAGSWATATGFSTLTQADIRDAVGLASANLDTQLAALAAYAASILDHTGSSGVVVASASKSGYSLSASGLDGITAESGVNLRQAVVIMGAALSGLLSGMGTGTITIKGMDSATTRITAVYDENNNRTSVTLNLPV